MIPRIFYCPQCKKQNIKSEQVYLLSLASEKKTIVITDSSPPEFTLCSHCGKKIDTQNIINGLHDLDPVTNEYQWVFFIMIIGVPVLCKVILGWPLVVAIFAGIIAGALAAYIIIEVIKRLQPQQRR